VDQLLTLSRLDSLENLDDVKPADGRCAAVRRNGLLSPAQQAGIDSRLHVNAPQTTHTGQQLLLSLLVRNLLDNAVRYSPRGSVVNVTTPVVLPCAITGRELLPMRWRARRAFLPPARAGLKRAAGWGYLS
jgi:signal transduction histidine kinase